MSGRLANAVVAVERANNELAAAIRDLPEIDAVAKRLATARATICDALSAINDVRQLASPEIFADLGFVQHDLQLAMRSIDELGTKVGIQRMSGQ